MNEHFPGKEGGEGHARWKEHGLVEGWRAGRLVLGLTAWRAGLEGRVGNTRGVEGQRHREQLPGVTLGLEFSPTPHHNS